MKKIYVLFIFFMFAFVLSDVPAQDANNRKINPDMIGYKTKEFFQISILGGFTEPIFSYRDVYNTSGNVGVEAAYRINREASIYAEAIFSFFNNRDVTRPNDYFLAGGIGPRFYFRAKGIRSSIFVEIGTGPYTRFISSYQTATGTALSQTIFNWGACGGLGGEIVMTNKIFVSVKAKYHAIFSSYGSPGIVTIQGGLTFRL